MLLQKISSSKWTDTWSNIKFTIKIMWKHARLSSFLAALLLIFTSLGLFLQIYAIQGLVNAVTNKQNLDSYVILYLGLVLLSLILNQSLQLFGGRLRVQMRRQLDAHFIPLVLQKYQLLPYPIFEDKTYIEILQRISENPHGDLISTYYSFLHMLTSLLTFIQMVFIFIFTNIYLGILTLIIVIPTIYLDMKVAKREMMQYWHATPEMAKRSYFQELFINKSCLQEIKVFQNHDFFIKKSDEMTEIINHDLKINIGTALKYYLCSTILLITYYCFFIAILMQQLKYGTVEFGLFVALITMIGNFYAARSSFAGSISNITRISQQVANLNKFLSLDEIDSKGYFSEIDKSSALIEFDNVSFKYPNTDKLVLNGISFVINEGEHVAFVGENGAGKSTIIKLLCGLYTVLSGSIRIYGTDISNYSSEDLSPILSVVFQDSQRFDMTLRENVALGDITKLDQDEEIKQTLKLINSQDASLANMPLDQKIGRTEEESLDLSGGQWQRLSIARALFSKHKILILDEPTAAQDPISESRLYELFYSIIAASNKTSIMISHRLASCRLSDKIFVLDEGKIESVGSHDELMNKNGIYADMFRRQSEWYVEE